MNPTTYSLKQMLWAPPLIIAFFGAAAYFFFYRAAFDHKSLVLFHAIRLSVPASTLAYWVLFAIALAFVFLGVLVLFATLQGKRVVTISKTSITVPKFSIHGLHYVEIPFSTIRNIELYRAGNGLFLNIDHSRGKSTLAKAAFQSESDFQEVHTLLMAKTNG